MAAKLKKVIFRCPLVKKKVCLDVNSDEDKGLLSTKIHAQTVLKCDLQSMGGCNQRLEAFDSKCPAVAQAHKCSLK